MATPQVDDTWYRYEDQRYAPPLDEWERPCGAGRLAVELREYRVSRVTPKGVWLGGFYTRRFVLLEANKRFACPTKAEAMTSFLARKEKQAGILSSRLRNVELAIQMGKELEKKL